MINKKIAIWILAVGILFGIGAWTYESTTERRATYFSYKRLSKLAKRQAVELKAIKQSIELTNLKQAIAERQQQQQAPAVR